MLFSEFGVPLEAADDYGDCAQVLLSTDYPGEFILARPPTPYSVAESALAGFMPMSARFGDGDEASTLFTPKLHRERCLIDPGLVVPTKTAVRAAARYSLGLNLDFAATLDACLARHGDGWLTPELRSCFMELASPPFLQAVHCVSAELYDGEQLVAGEIGYVIGSSWASLSGFTTVSGAGTVQLYALAALLARAGTRVWDLGMPIDYKLRLGAPVLWRGDYLTELRRAYAEPMPAILGVPSRPEPAAKLLSLARAINPAG